MNRAAAVIKKANHFHCHCLWFGSRLPWNPTDRTKALRSWFRTNLFIDTHQTSPLSPIRNFFRHTMLMCLLSQHSLTRDKRRKKKKEFSCSDFPSIFPRKHGFAGVSLVALPFLIGHKLRVSPSTATKRIKRKDVRVSIIFHRVLAIFVAFLVFNFAPLFNEFSRLSTTTHWLCEPTACSARERMNECASDVGRSRIAN